MKDIKQESIFETSVKEMAFSLASNAIKTKFLEDSNTVIAICSPSVYRVQPQIIKSLLQS